ncbi:MAG: hypothetical protein MMC23_009177 [Stictis urceolatum]|nr:hypothetical protein [Stictis urceolata]
MLWLAAQTCEAPALTDGPSSRARVSQKLLDLTMDLLKPLRHHSEGQSSKGHSLREGERLRDHQYSSPQGNLLRPGGDKLFNPSSNIDHIITYIHLGTVFSASEHKASSIRWWSVAWSMARDLRLNKELSPHQDVDQGDEEAQQNSSYSSHRRSVHLSSQDISQEEREERRRIWWLLYMCDRHLSLCYNQPLSLTDIECETLLQPLDERIWQNARLDELEDILSNTEGRPRGPQTKCHNLSLYGYFLPLMTILGGIIDFTRAKTHPRFGRYSKANPFWDELASDISAQLDDYYYTLEQLGGTHVEMGRAEDALQQRIAVAYGSHIMHVMHILLSGKWDPIVLLEDEDHWVGSQSFVITTKHATGAAEVISSIFDSKHKFFSPKAVAMRLQFRTDDDRGDQNLV